MQIKHSALKQTLFIFTILTFGLLFSCKRNIQVEREKTIPAVSLTREERVKKIPYRFQQIDESEKDSLRKDVLTIYNQFNKEIEDNNSLLLGLRRTHDGFVRFDRDFTSLKELKEYLNSAWKNKNFIGTVAVFNSKSNNIENVTLEKLLVFEFEYEYYTGTWTAFLELPISDKDILNRIELQYYERN